jgi:hypothetical protein
MVVQVAAGQRILALGLVVLVTLLWSAPHKVTMAALEKIQVVRLLVPEAEQVRLVRQAALAAQSSLDMEEMALLRP